MLNFYLTKIIKQIPDFEYKYFRSPSLCRLKHIDYFCAMKYASKDVYQFEEDISRFTHSMTTSFQAFKLTEDKTKTIAGLCHDIATPCFSHVIDYMNKDYDKQESTEEYTEKIIRNDEYLLECLKKDGIKVDDIINFKQFKVVDSDRPKLCADRLDGIILTGISWTKSIDRTDIESIVNSIELYQNEDNEEEIGFDNENVAERVVQISNEINDLCHSSEDNYMMELLAKITSYAIYKNYIKYEDLYILNEKQIFDILEKSNDSELLRLLFKFHNIQKEQIPKTNIPNLKVRTINPLVNGKRLI